MAELINMPRAAWRRQPQNPVEVNWGHALAKDLKLVNTPALVQKNVSSFTTPPTFFPGINELFVSSAGATSVPYLSPATGITVFGRYGWVGSGDDGFMVRSGVSGGGWRIEKTYLHVRLTFYSVANYSGAQVVFSVEDWLPNVLSIANVFINNGASITYLNGKSILSENIGTAITSTENLTIESSRHSVLLVFSRMLSVSEISDLNQNPWQLFRPAPSRFILIPSSGGGSTVTSAVSVDALLQRAGLTQSTSIDALLQAAFSRSLSIDGLIVAVQSGVISLDALLQIAGTHTVSIDALLQATKTGAVSVDALVQMTLAQSLSLDALIQALQTAGLSLDALLSQSKTATAVMDALIQASKSGAVSLDAIITGASSTTVFVGLDALIQAIQAKTISLDALLQKSYTSPLALDAYVALTQVKTISLDALLQSTKSGVISLDAILQMTKTAMVSFDALIQAAKTGVISLDAILVFATQASLLLDAYVQKTLSAGVGLDAIIGAIADMILPTGRVITVPASDRFVFVTHSDRVIQIQ